MSNRITHIRKPNVNSSEEHITHVKGIDSDGKIFQLTVAEVIYYLKKNYSFYVEVGKDKISVSHQKSVAGNEFIKTKPDSTKRDNLLSLPQF